MDPRALDENEIVIEDGSPGAKLSTADPRDLLRLAVEYLDAVMAVAKHHKIELVLADLWVENRSRAAGSRVSDVPSARAAMDLADGYRRNRHRPRALNQVFERLDRAIRRSGAKKFGARLGPQKYIPLAPIVEEESPYLWEETSLWLKVMATGSKSDGDIEDSITFKDDLDDDVFSVQASIDDVRRLGNSIKKYVRAELSVVRDVEGKIIRGTLLHADEPNRDDETSEYEVWQRWIRSSIDTTATLANLRKGSEE